MACWKIHHLARGFSQRPCFMTENLTHRWFPGWWFGTWILWLSIYWKFHNPNWLSYLSGGFETTNQFWKHLKLRIFSPGLLLEQKAPPLLEALFGWIDCGDLEMMTALLERKASVNECLGCEEWMEGRLGVIQFQYICFSIKNKKAKKTLQNPN